MTIQFNHGLDTTRFILGENHGILGIHGKWDELLYGLKVGLLINFSHCGARTLCESEFKNESPISPAQLFPFRVFRVFRGSDRV